MPVVLASAETLAAPLPAIRDAVPTAVEPVFDAFAPVFDPGGGMWMAVRGQSVCEVVAARLDAIAAAVQAMVDTLAMALHAVRHPGSVIGECIAGNQP